MKDEAIAKIEYLFKKYRNEKSMNMDTLMKAIIEVVNRSWPGITIVKAGDSVNSPSHYIGHNGIEVEQVNIGFLSKINDGYVGHRIGSAIEYLLRAGEKNGKEDIQKAKKNIEMVLDYLDEKGF